MQEIQPRAGQKYATAENLRLESVKLKVFRDADGVGNGFQMLTVSPERQVYEITWSIKGPYEYRGNTFGSGKQVRVIDAETGVPLFTAIRSPMLRSSRPSSHTVVPTSPATPR